MESIRKIVREAVMSDMSCPLATKDSDLNSANKKKTAISNEYGLPTEEAKEKEQSCANCVAFDISERMKDCMGNFNGEVGYCWMHDFMCSGKKWCNTWLGNKPITSNIESYEKQLKK